MAFIIDTNLFNRINNRMGLENQDEISTLISRNLMGLADSFEMARLRKWIEDSDENEEFFRMMQNIWELSDKNDALAKISIEESIKKVQSRIFKVSPARKLWQYWQKIAAIIIPLLVASITILRIYQNSNKKFASNLNDIVYNEVFAPFGTRSSLRLADSTLVWLNSGSSLRYPNKFNNNTRTVLLNGEAYFEINSDSSKPFVVQTSSLQVKATGTKFGVKAYDSDSITEVTLVSGELIVNELDKNGDLNFIAELYPNQHMHYKTETKMKYIRNEDIYRFIAWKDGKLIFRNDSLLKVLNTISIMFNVDIELQGKELQDYRYRATFCDESLEEILKLLKLSSPIDFTEVKRVPRSDGSFPKKKIIVYKADQAKNNKLTD